MKRYISEEEAIYQDHYHGQFSKKLATWAVSNMGCIEHGCQRPRDRGTEAYTH